MMRPADKIAPDSARDRRPAVTAAPGLPQPPARVEASDALSTGFPILRVLESLERWQSSPVPEHRDAIAAALGEVLAMVGAHGAVLRVEAPPLPALVVGAGSLARPEDAPPRDRAGWKALGAEDGHETLGSLFLDAPPALVEPIARMLELAVDAAWSRAAVHDRADRLTALEAATRAVAAELDVERVLQLIVDGVKDLVGARYAALGIADSRGQIERFITSGVTPEERAGIGPVPRGHGLLGLIIREGRTVRTPDIAAHPRSHGFPPNHPVMRTFLGVPVAVKGRSVGNLYLTDKAHGEPFTPDDERLVEMFAVHAGIAIENARLHDQVQRLAVVEERERIAKDLHDGIIQSIYAVGLSLEDVPDLVEDDRTDAVARIDRAIDALNLVIADIRSYILRLSQVGEEEDPVEALARLGEELGMHAVVDLEVDLEGGASTLRQLPPDRRSDLLFVAREALSNVARHSGASRASLALELRDGSLQLTIEDNGRGFDPDLVAGPDEFGRHLGISNMRNRTVGIGGTFTIERPEPSGTRIIVRVPASSGGASGDRRSTGTGEP